MLTWKNGHKTNTKDFVFIYNIFFFLPEKGAVASFKQAVFE